MSLYQASEGILQTHVTWEEFERNLISALKTSARCGPKKRATDIGEGSGFASRCALIECDWQGAGDDEQLPKRVVLKLGSCMALVDMDEKMPEEKRMFKNAPPEMWQNMERGVKGLHNHECDWYDFLALLGRGHAIPTRYYAERFTDENTLNGQICMEYIENSRNMNFWEEATLDQCTQVARALGKLQADSLKHEAASGLIRSKGVLKEIRKNTPLEKYVQMFGPLKAMEASLTNAVEGVETILPEYYGATVLTTLHKQLGITPVLVHGDMRTENILIDKDSGDLRALIDWQCSHLGVGVEDLVRISLFAQTAADRRASAVALVEEMYASMVANLGTMPAPYTLEQLKEIYDILLPHCALNFAASLPLLMPAHVPREGDNEVKKDRYAVIVDKARGALEDIVTYHEKNKTSKYNVNWTYAAA